MNSKQEYFVAANYDPLVQIRGITTGQKLFLRKYTHGVLVPDDNYPLSLVSVSNSSLSIDLWIGCAWQCRYCHAQGAYQNLAEYGSMPKKPRRRNQFTIDQILDELIKHPFFVVDETVISIGTASTEPFASVAVDSTFEIMDAFVRRNLRNPFWIVTKNGIPKGRKLDFARVVNATRGLMISLCWADNPDTIEPMRNNRFLNVEEAKEAGVTVAWHMRPIVPEWSGNRDRIEMMMLWVKKHYSKVIDIIVPGGLRWTEGVENGLVEIHGLSMPDIPRNDNVKVLPQELIDFIFLSSAEHFPGVPIYLKSSCAITKMLKIPSITSVQVFARDKCELSHCSIEQRHICSKGSVYNMTAEKAQVILDNLGVPARVVGWDINHGLSTYPEIDKFAYAVRQTIFKHLAMEGFS